MSADTHTPQRKKAQMASALFNDVQLLGLDALRNTEAWDALTCDEQMRVEDLCGLDHPIEYSV
jgi:hypothetical protein|tara:strand:- start:322 stop:510 length:189 start_codon:yes stop_codon:yes gene_type:complete